MVNSSTNTERKNEKPGFSFPSCVRIGNKINRSYSDLPTSLPPQQPMTKHETETGSLCPETVVQPPNQSPPVTHTCVPPPLFIFTNLSHTLKQLSPHLLLNPDPLSLSQLSSHSHKHTFLDHWFHHLNIEPALNRCLSLVLSMND